MNIQEVVVLVTGGASGLGLATANHFKAQGARVMTWDKTPSLQPFHIVCDVSHPLQVESAFLETTERMNAVPRILVHCAGIAPAQRMVGREGPMDLEAFRQVIEVNLVGTFNVMRVVAHAMSLLEGIGPDRERGVLINTASIAAEDGQVGQAAYSASKGGVVSMTLPLARELAMHHIRVNTIAPGVMETPMLLNMPIDVQNELTRHIPYPKRLGYGAEFAALAQHICENTLLNGTVIRLDGALRMPSGVK